MNTVIMNGVREYSEELDIKIGESNCDKAAGREVVWAFNEGGYNNTQIDILDLLSWIMTNRPDLLARKP